jgi:antitoxin ParD1/3/4
MTSLNISLPDDLKKLVDERVTEGGFASHSQYVRSLIRRDHRRLNRERIETKLLHRLESGAPVEVTDRDFHKIRTRLKESMSQSCTVRKLRQES